MSRSITAAVYESYGNPAEVLQLQHWEWPRPRSGEVLVRMHAAPINPADLNQIEGKYPVRFPLPATPGFEGSGVVVERGENVQGLTNGAHVILPHSVGTWREAVCVKADDLVEAPAEIDLDQLAMMKINPLTAWRLLHGYVALNRGDWLIQNAANSAAGRCVIQISKELGYRTINVVRRAELISELEADGADVVLVDSEKLRDEVKEHVAAATIMLGLNAVGGDAALRLANCLASDATMVTYGAMSLQPLKVPNGLLIFKNLNFRGIWINKWYDAATREERMAAFEPLFAMAKRGLLQTKVARTYALSELREAVTHAAQAERGGKILLRMNA